MKRRRRGIKKEADTCIFCFKCDGHPLLGPLIDKCGIKVHTNCVVIKCFFIFQFTASGLSQKANANDKRTDHVDGFLIDDIKYEVKRGRSLFCSICRKSVACVGCNVSSCVTSFHLPCLIKSHGLTIFKDPFPSYCRRHAPKQVSFCCFLSVCF